MKRELIALAGPPFSGKSAAGIILSRLLGAEFIETDQLIEKSAGKSIPMIFSKLGESEFRSIEKEVIRNILEDQGIRKTVIALGGGSLLDSESLELVLTNCKLFTLTASLDTLVKRNNGGRPLITDDTALRELIRTREEHYNALGNPINTENKTPSEVAEVISVILRKEDPSLWSR